MARIAPLPRGDTAAAKRPFVALFSNTSNLYYATLQPA
jgi:hypothetical protein